MACPNCGATWVDEIESNFSDPNHHVELYSCPECGCEFKWESTCTIEKEAEEKEDDFNKRLKEIQAQKKRLIKLEDEEDEE